MKPYVIMRLDTDEYAPPLYYVPCTLKDIWDAITYLNATGCDIAIANPSDALNAKMMRTPCRAMGYQRTNDVITDLLWAYARAS